MLLNYNNISRQQEIKVSGIMCGELKTIHMYSTMQWRPYKTRYIGLNSDCKI